MTSLETILDSLNFQYFRAGDEYLLIFRGQALDHYVLLREGEHFLHATCQMGRAPAHLDSETSEYLLDWNAGHNLARTAVANGEFLVLGDLPIQGLQEHGVEELVLAVATAAEELGREILPRIMANVSETPAATGPQDAAVTPRKPRSAPQRGRRDRTASVPEGELAPTAPNGEPEIDWDAEDN